MSFDKLERNLIDIIKEEQAKLGFFEEDIRLYYPLSSLNHFFDSTDNAGEMQERLEHFRKVLLTGSVTSGLLTRETVSVFIFHRKVRSLFMRTQPPMNLSVSW